MREWKPHEKKRIERAKAEGRRKCSDWLKRKIDRSFCQEASPAAKLLWLDAPKRAPERPQPAWNAHDLNRLPLPPDAVARLREAGIDSIAKLQRAEALKQLPQDIDRAAITAALEQLEN